MVEAMTQETPATALCRSWNANAAAWTQAVRGGAIASRRLATDAAVVRAVNGLSPRPRRVLDLGCGEGWLARALAAEGAEVVGVDGSAPLIEAARAAGGGTFLHLDYALLAADPSRAGSRFDAVCANFALLDDDPAPLLRALRETVVPEGHLVIQTLHPLAAGEPYRDGWRTEDFRGFGGEPAGWSPMPWYFRTLSSWLTLLRHAGWHLIDLHEPRHPDTGAPLSLLLTAARCCGKAPPPRI